MSWRSQRGVRRHAHCFQHSYKEAGYTLVPKGKASMGIEPLTYAFLPEAESNRDRDVCLHIAFGQSESRDPI